MANWPRIHSEQESEETRSGTKYHCWSETTMPCGDELKVSQNGFNKNNVKRRAETAVAANARRHLRSCKRCKVG